ncbi:hypothetical protein BDB01DRAFT_809251 [Pilobolus umbonatus]|nr:hypothetical protein BDB01DRAFT_809251 [Pilobolus umbonatus]
MSTTPIVKLPPPHSKSCSTNRSNYDETLLQQQKQSYDQPPMNHIPLTYRPNIFQSKDLYFEDSEAKILDYDIQQLLHEYHLTNIKRERGGGYLSFPDSIIAERVYSLFNGYNFSNQSVLKFKLSTNDQYDPQAEGPILEVRHLPLHIDHNILYDEFRPYGPLSICKPITEDDTHKGKALIQYFYKEDSDNALNNLNNKLYHGNKLSISVFTPNHTRYQDNYSYPTFAPITHTPVEKNSVYIDYMNLYVKNLDPSIDSTEFSQLFQDYGHIVSARVMSNHSTGQSKGYGFVSFSKAEDAARALQCMNGFQARSKALVVSYHESRKPRQEKSTSTTTSSFHSPPPHADYTNAPYFETKHPHEVPMNGIGIEPMEHMNHVKEMVMKPLPFPTHHKLSREPSLTPPPTVTQHHHNAKLTALALGASIQPPPNMPEHIEERAYEPPRTLRRKGSLESVSSVLTESSSQLQRHKMTNAVKRCGNYGSDLDDIVDMLLTLKRKQRSICLFNPDFLKDQIDLALEALEVCETDEIPPRHKAPSPPIHSRKILNPFPIIHTPVAQIPHIVSTPMSSHQHPTKPNLYEHMDSAGIVIQQRKSKAIPIVAPTPATPAKSVEVKAMLNSFEGKSIHEKKQLLGDRLFPLVKATGIKQAPKITIRLLDTIELSTLANIMFDKDLLKAQVEKAASSQA